MKCSRREMWEYHMCKVGNITNYTCTGSGSEARWCTHVLHYFMYRQKSDDAHVQGLKSERCTSERSEVRWQTLVRSEIKCVCTLIQKVAGILTTWRLQNIYNLWYIYESLFFPFFGQLIAFIFNQIPEENCWTKGLLFWYRIKHR
jgi:hypothetical protein